jgi:hypothetical protein
MSRFERSAKLGLGVTGEPRMLCGTSGVNITSNVITTYNYIFETLRRGNIEAAL